MKKNVQIFYIIILTIACIIPVAVYAVVGKYMDSSSYENRTLAKRPELSISTINDFPTQFENYFNDNLPFKNQLVFLNGLFNYKILKTSSSESVIVGKNGWLFYKGAQVNDEDPISDYNGSNLFSQEQLDTIAVNMVTARDELRMRGIEFVIMIAPNKERMYSEYMPGTYGEPAMWCRMTQLTDYLNNNTDLNVVCPYENMLEYKKDNPQDQLYYKYDTHWNNLGSYLGACDLDAALGHEMPKLNSLDREEGKVPTFDLATLIHLGNVLEDDKVYVLDGYNEHNASVERSSDGLEFRGSIPAADGDERKLFVIGDSFSTMMFPYVACNFNESYLNFYYNYNLEMLEQEAPDVVVYETVERYLNNMLNFSITEGIDAEAEN